jgi:hypothetical protein
MTVPNQIKNKLRFIKFVCKSLLIFLIFFSSCPGQTLQEVFKDDLPIKFIKEESDLKNINYNLEYYSSIHPDLIFYYIRYLRNLLELKIKEPNLNGLKQLYILRDFYLTKRNNWLEYQVSHIEGKDFIRIKNSAMVKDFEDYIEDVDISNVITLVHNDSTEYFNFKFFKKNSKLHFDQSIDYYKSNLQILDSVARSINNNLTHLSNLNDDNALNILDKILNYWYLFTHDNALQYNFSLIEEPYELTIKVFKDEYYETSGAIASVEYFVIWNSYVPFDGIFYFEDYVLPTFIQPIKYTFPAKITQTPVFSISAGYKFKLKNEIGFLSNLKVKASYTYLESDIEFEGANEEFYRFNHHIITADSVASYIYYATDFYQSSNQYISIQFISPLFYWYKSFFIEIGLSFDYYFYKYSANVYREDALVYIPTNSKNVISIDKRSELLVEEFNFYFTPILTINYSPLYQWQIFTGFYLNQYLKISLGLSYEL